jgi:hypothetical protein
VPRLPHEKVSFNKWNNLNLKILILAGWLDLDQLERETGG